MKQLGSLSLFGIFLLAIACQPTTKKKEKESTIFPHLTVQYRQNDRLFLAEANYFIGDSLSQNQILEMTSVTFQGGTMTQSSSTRKPLFYKTERQSDFQSDLKFKAHSPAGHKITTDLNFNPIESFLLKNQISKTEGLTLVWKGLPLSEEESLLLLVADQNNKAASSTITGPTQRTEIQIEGTFLKELLPGKGNLFLVRKKKGMKSEEQSIAQYDLSYYTSPLAIEILP